MLNTVASYHRIQFQGKLIIQTQENGKKPHFVPDFSPLSPNTGCQFFFHKTSSETLFQAIILWNLKES